MSTEIVHRGCVFRERIHACETREIRMARCRRVHLDSGPHQPREQSQRFRLDRPCRLHPLQAPAGAHAAHGHLFTSSSSFAGDMAAAPTRSTTDKVSAAGFETSRLLPMGEIAPPGELHPGFSANALAIDDLNRPLLRRLAGVLDLRDAGVQAVTAPVSRTHETISVRVCTSVRRLEDESVQDRAFSCRCRHFRDRANS
jgi:hypothetical protein